MRIRFISSLLATTVAAALALTACAPLDTGEARETAPLVEQSTTVLPTDVRGEWSLSRWTSETGSLAIPDNGSRLIFYAEALRVHAGCFIHDAPISPELEMVTDAYEPPPRAQCLALSAGPHESISHMADVTTVARADDHLTFTGTDSDGAVFSLEFERVPVSANGRFDSATPPQPDVRGSWSFDNGTLGDSVSGYTALHLADDGARFEFNDGSARANGMCMQLDVPMRDDLFAVTNDYEKISDSSCAALGPSPQRDSEVLSDVTSASRAGNRLTLTGPDLRIEFVITEVNGLPNPFETLKRPTVVSGKWTFEFGRSNGAEVVIAPRNVVFQFTPSLVDVDAGCSTFDIPLNPDLNLVSGPVAPDREDGCFRLDALPDDTVQLLRDATTVERDVLGLTFTGPDFELHFTQYRER